MKKINSVQDWLPLERIFEKGIIQTKENEYIKIIKITPINYNLKSNLEKEAILNSYKIFLKTCNFNIQILVQSNRENLSQHISQIEKQNEKQSKKIFEISQMYIQYINSLNHEKKSSNKTFFILIKNSQKEANRINRLELLNEEFFKIKECLERCGNQVIEIKNRKQLQEILFSFINLRQYLNQ